MRVVIHRNFASLNKLIPKWKILFNEYREITIFQNVNWLDNWWNIKNNKNKDFHPYIVEVSLKGKTIGIFPLYITYKKLINVDFRILRPLGWDYSDYILPMLSRGVPMERLVNCALLKIYEDKANWDCIEWGQIPENTSYHTHLNNFLIQKKKIYKRMNGEMCPYISLDKGIHHIYEQCDQSFLKQISSKEKRLMKKGSLSFEKVIDEIETEFIMKRLFELHCKRWKHTETPSIFTEKNERDCALLNAKKLVRNNLLHLTYLRFNNEIVAVHYGMSDGNRLYYYIPAYDIDYQRYSVGSILTYRLIQSAVIDGYAVFDFLKGNEGYKSLFGAKGKRNITFLLYNHTFQSKLYKKLEETYFSTHFKERSSIYQFSEKVRVRCGIFALNTLDKLTGTRDTV